jgi:hypothetical protein
MFRQLSFLAAVGALAMLAGGLQPRSFGVGVSPAVAADEAQRPWLTLSGGVKVRFVTAVERSPESGASGSRELFVIFEFEDRTVLKDHAKLIDVADQLFGSVVVVPAETKGFKLAAVNFLTSDGSDGVQAVEDFHYARRDDAVWLRQAGTEDWKVAQDPAFTPPASETVDLGDAGVAEVSFIAEIDAPKGSTRAIGIEMRTDTPIASQAKKYQEVRALWNRLDIQKMKADGFDYADVRSYADRLRGRFQVRKYARLQIKRPSGQDWPTLPETMPTSGKGPLIAWAQPPADNAGSQMALAKDESKKAIVRQVLLDLNDQHLNIDGAIGLRTPAAAHGTVLPVDRYLKSAK